MNYYVYRFLNEESEVIYVGRTNSLRTRISSHFSVNGHLPEGCYNNTKRIEYIEMDSEIDMVIKEIYYISKFKPFYNRKSFYDCTNMLIDPQEKADNWTLYEFNNREAKKSADSKIHIRLGELLKERNISVFKLAEMTNLKINTIEKLISDRGNRIPVEPVNKIITALKITNINELIIYKA